MLKGIAAGALMLLIAVSSAAQAAPGVHGGKFIAQFEAANVTHDGHLTLAQAQQGRMRRIARNFAAIDRDGKGFVTMADIRTYRRAMRASGAGKQAVR